MQKYLKQVIKPVIYYLTQNFTAKNIICLYCQLNWKKNKDELWFQCISLRYFYYLLMFYYTCYFLLYLRIQRKERYLSNQLLHEV